MKITYFDRIDRRWRREMWPDVDKAHERLAVLRRCAFAINVSGVRL